jgi:serine/tyrosine/threonine adenylyltransferase
MDKTDESKIFRPLLTIMQEHKLDYHSTFRKLCFFPKSFLETSVNGDVSDGQDTSSSVLEKFIGELLASTLESQSTDIVKAAKDWMAWFEEYAQRIDSEREEWTGDVDAEREKAAKSANPRFVLRQWLLEEVIANVEKDIDSGKRLLAKVLHVSVTITHTSCYRFMLRQIHSCIDGLQPI